LTANYQLGNFVSMKQVHPLRAYRERQDPPLNRRQLADLLGVSTASVSRWEAGERKPDEEVLLRIVKKTGIPASVLRPDLAELLRIPASLN
jgi:transcriptional regulator with XRE-family HTH domain